MTVVSGTMKIQRPGKQQQTFCAGESFDVPANSSFDVNVGTDTAYLCLYG
jgi:uncharacterized protein YaiE (UPF0345 family)